VDRAEVVVRSELIFSVNGVPLCAETFGEPGDPAILLIMGAGASMDWWEDAFCERLAAGSRLVIRYDHRDTGRSIACAAGSPDYTGADLQADAVGILDAAARGNAHLVGMSMGGALAQLIALEHPERVASLTLISTTQAVGETSDLPGMSEEAAERFAIPRPRWPDRRAAIEYLVAIGRASASTSQPFDEEALHVVAGRMFDRSANIAAALTNHDLIDPAPTPAATLDELALPTLVIHGTDDPLFPLEHGIALAEAIPGTRLLPLDGVGHELPGRAWDRVVPAITELTAEAEAQRGLMPR
jgi:pimeloyl-ACP methyl ester carboxylesterase